MPHAKRKPSTFVSVFYFPQTQSVYTVIATDTQRYQDDPIFMCAIEYHRERGMHAKIYPYPVFADTVLRRGEYGGLDYGRIAGQLRSWARREFPELRPVKTTEKPYGRSLRFDVLKRDGYRCQLCGRSAQQHGVVLEVDHKHARARGGKDTLDNLHTLCFDCNRGKRDKEL